MCYNEDICAMKQAHIAKIEKRNNELKQRLDNATEIIKKFLNAKSIEDTCVAESEAERFLKENE